MVSVGGELLLCVIFLLTEAMIGESGFSCPSDANQVVTVVNCEGNLTCPSGSHLNTLIFMNPEPSSFAPAACTLVVTTRSEGLVFHVDTPISVTETGACTSWLTLRSLQSQLSTQQAASACTKSLYKSRAFFIPGNVTAMISNRALSSAAGYALLTFKEATAVLLCQQATVHVVSSVSAIIPHGSAYNSCRTAVTVPAGATLGISITEIVPRSDSGLEEKCLCYSLQSKPNETLCWSSSDKLPSSFRETITIVVASDSAGPRCSAVMNMIVTVDVVAVVQVNEGARSTREATTPALAILLVWIWNLQSARPMGNRLSAS